MTIFNIFSKILCRIIFNHSFFIKRKFKNKKILFDFDYKNKFNLGDTLFFVPLLYDLSKNKKVFFEVKASKTQRSIIDFFIKNITYANNRFYNNDYLIVKSINLFNFFDFLKNRNLIYFDTTSNIINQPVSNFILKSFLDLLNIKQHNLPFNFISKSKLVNSKKILFSDEVNSGIFRLRKKHYSTLYNIIEQYYNMGFTIYRIGKSHKYLKLINFEFIDLEKESDLSSVILSISNRKYYRIISFDTFIAHLGCIFDIDTHIVMREFNKEYTKRLKMYYFPIIKKLDKTNVIFHTSH